MPLSLDQYMSLQREIETAIELVDRGKGELRRIDFANDFYYLPVLLLANGYERLMKSLLIVASIDEKGDLKKVPFSTSGSKAHDLRPLLDLLISKCEESEYASRCVAAAEDVDYLKNNADLKEIVELLSDFAQGGRYYNLNIVLNRESGFSDPERGWGKIETKILSMKPDLEEKLLNHDPEFYSELNRELTIILDRFTRAIARFFVWSDFKEFARQFSSSVTHYLMLRDRDLGRK